MKIHLTGGHITFPTLSDKSDPKGCFFVIFPSDKLVLQMLSACVCILH